MSLNRTRRETLNLQYVEFDTPRTPKETATMLESARRQRTAWLAAHGLPCTPQPPCEPTSEALTRYDMAMAHRKWGTPYKSGGTWSL